MRLLLMTVTGSVMLSGCSVLGVHKEAKPITVLDPSYLKSEQEIKADLILLREFVKTNEDAYFVSSDPVERKRLRDAIITTLRKSLEIQWVQYTSDYYNRISHRKTIFNSTSNGLSTVAAITTPTRSAAIVSALSSITGNINTNIDTNELNSQTATAIFQQMNSDVKIYKAKIDQNLLKPDSQYPLSNAYSDLIELAGSMTKSHALTEMAAAAAAPGQKVKEIETFTVEQEIKRVAGK